MDTFEIYRAMRETLARIRKRAVDYAPAFRDGTALATWLEDKIDWTLAQWRDHLALGWHLSDATHALTLADFRQGAESDAEIAARLNAGGIGGLDAVAARFTERDRAKLIGFFRADMNDSALNVGGALLDIDAALAAAGNRATALYPSSGDVTAIKYVNRDGRRLRVSKTIDEMGLDGAPLAGDLDGLAAAVGGLLSGT